MHPPVGQAADPPRALRLRSGHRRLPLIPCGRGWTYVNPAIAVAAGALFLGEPLTATVLAAFALILTGSVLANAERKPVGRRVPWSTRQTSRAGGRVESLTGLPEERPGSTGQGGG
ncbi:hypothetical protein GCM10010297_12070 [Streptomyces malachitofuscus]|nr:hypothetical protein GCM10010297_12070 [Streptomyces malachitofuscus]